ncbi:MAG TPA: gfo/Idh/MocA family oxidoreductase, partial [Synergistales bacterium]|nr:gfo/Idh/MocA family oxidoreductase [Synergistales bacterium]
TCVREGKQPLVGITDGKRALEVAVSVLKQIHLDDQQFPEGRQAVSC